MKIVIDKDLMKWVDTKVPGWKVKEETLEEIKEKVYFELSRLNKLLDERYGEARSVNVGQ